MSWQVEVQTHDMGLDEWFENSFRFAEHDEAEAYGIDLTHRWSAVRRFRLLESPDPANVTFADNYLRPFRL